MAFSFSNIAQYHQALLNNTTTCTIAVEHYLQAIIEHNHLNAMVAVFGEEARAKAAILDTEIATNQHDKSSLPPLFGVVVAIKDVLCYRDHPVTASSRMLEGFHSLYSATAVQRLLDAGAIIIGTCNCDEFAMGSTNENSVYGAARNAYDPQLVPGGSSGGSAVAVQAGLCMVSLGSDTGGSVRQPADFCGVVGLKPTYGRISRYGLIAYASSFDCIGIFATNVEDVATVYQQIAGPDTQDSTSLAASLPVMDLEPKASYRFAYLSQAMELPGLDPEIRSGMESAFQTLRSQGHAVERVEFDLLEYIVPAYYVLTTAEASSNLNRYDGVRYGHQSGDTQDDLTAFYKANRSEGFGPEVKRRIMLGSFVLSAGYFDAYFTKAQQVRRLITDRTSTIFNDFDAILMPVSPTTAFPIGTHTNDPVTLYLADIFTVYANLAGIPGMAIPLFRHSNGLPFGLQVLTNRQEEVTLHAICRLLMKKLGKPQKV